MRGKRLALAIVVACALAAPGGPAIAAVADDIAALVAQIESALETDQSA